MRLVKASLAWWGGLGLRFQNHFPDGSAEDLHSSLRCSHARGNCTCMLCHQEKGPICKVSHRGACWGGRRQQVTPCTTWLCWGISLGHLHLADELVEDAIRRKMSIGQVRGQCPSIILDMSTDTPSTRAWCGGVVQCKHVMEQGVCSLSIEVSKSKWSKKLMPRFKDSNHPSCPQKRNILKQNRKASSNHFHLSVQAIETRHSPDLRA